MRQAQREASAAVHGVTWEREVMVPMRDGIRLATDLYFPAEGARRAPGPWPVILERTPYGKRRLDLVATAKRFARHGYVVALQDVRGRFASEGDWYPFALEAPDGYDTVEWLATREWSNGKVGTMGCSYAGSDQHALANLAPPHLTAMFPSEAMSNYHTASMRQGGAAELRFLVYAFRMAWDSPAAQADPTLRDAVKREWDQVTRWLGRAPLKPGVSVLRHFPSIERWVLDVIRRGDYDGYWKQLGLNVEEHYDAHADVPICLFGGWYDSYARATTDNFVELSRRKRGPVRLIMGPWVHGVATVAQSWAGDADFGVDAAEDYDGLRLRFFDTALKGLDTGLWEEPPVRIFVMGGGTGRKLLNGHLDHGGRWRDEPTWPLERARPTAYHLHGDGTLRTQPPTAEVSSTTYRYDPLDPVPTIGGNISAAEEVLPAGGFDQRGRPGLIGCADALPVNARHDVVTFQTPPLERDTEVTGPIGVHLWVSSSAVDTDFTAKLIDVYPPSADYPDGYALNIGDSIVRARYREGRERAVLMTPGEIYRLEIVLYPTSNLFAAGHRIRLDVSSSNHPRFDVNPNTGDPLGVGGRAVPADNTIHHDADHPSHVTLPIVPS
jgi:putative CocE/NonD family hydrolase